MYKRGKGKVKSHNGLPGVIKMYKEMGGILNPTTCSKILREMNGEISRLIVQENLELNMPERLGTLRVRKFKININTADGEVDITRLGPDWQATRKLWKELYPGKTGEELKAMKGKPIVRHLNKHSNGYSHEFYYNKQICNVKNKSAYTFAPARSLKNLLTSTIKDTEIRADFYE